jgi:hypothetical protein
MEELEYLKPSLALMHGRIAVRGIHFLERPQLRHALAHVDLFSPAAASDVSLFDSILRQIESYSALYEADYAIAVQHVERTWAGAKPSPGLLEYDPKWVADIRKMIEGAQALVPHLNQRLLGES